MMITKVTFALIAIALQQTLLQAQILGSGDCPAITPVSGFNIKNFAGKWYEIQKYPFMSNRGKCQSVSYTINSANNVTIAVEFMMGPKNIKLQDYASVESTAGAWTFTFPKWNIETTYTIVDTDYANYAVIFACGRAGPFNGKMAWILGRSRVLSTDLIGTATAAMTKQSIATSSLKPTIQKDCTN